VHHNVNTFFCVTNLLFSYSSLAFVDSEFITQVTPHLL